MRSGVHLRDGSGLIPIDAGSRRRQPGRCAPPLRHEWRLITVLAIIALVLIAIVALAIFGFVAHILFSPWLLLVAVGILAWLMFSRRRSRQ